MMRIELALALGNLPTKQKAPDPLSAARGHSEQPTAPNTTADGKPNVDALLPSVNDATNVRRDFLIRACFLLGFYRATGCVRAEPTQWKPSILSPGQSPCWAALCRTYSQH
jgi:hypothetical protein